MTQSNEITIEQKNRTICEFLGWEFKEDPKFEYMAYFEGRQMWCDNLQGVNKTLKEGFIYHSDWNKLKPVIDQIHTYAIAYPKEVEPVITMSIVVNIDAAHEKVYQVCKWLNQQKQNNDTKQ